MENRSKAILGMEDSAFARSLFKSMGYTDSELKEGKPLIGIANTWNTLVPGHYNLDKVAEYVKNGIYAAGGTAVEFGTIAACDGVAQGHEGMHYILPSREIICDSVEIMAQAHRLDGLVLLAAYSTADLTDSGLRVYAAYGSEDGVLNREKYEADRVNLPQDTTETVIDGGCHAGFGSYGAQKGDGTPTISAEEQQRQTADALAAWMNLQ